MSVFAGALLPYESKDLLSSSVVHTQLSSDNSIVFVLCFNTWKPNVALNLSSFFTVPSPCLLFSPVLILLSRLDSALPEHV